MLQSFPRKGWVAISALTLGEYVSAGFLKQEHLLWLAQPKTLLAAFFLPAAFWMVPSLPSSLRNPSPGGRTGQEAGIPSANTWWVWVIKSDDLSICYLFPWSLPEPQDGNSLPHSESLHYSLTTSTLFPVAGWLRGYGRCSAPWATFLLPLAIPSQDCRVSLSFKTLAQTPPPLEALSRLLLW